jgi:hypothetical protein
MQIHVLDWIDEATNEVTHHHKCLYLISIDTFKIICYTVGFEIYYRVWSQKLLAWAFKSTMDWSRVIWPHIYICL